MAVHDDRRLDLAVVQSIVERHLGRLKQDPRMAPPAQRRRLEEDVRAFLREDGPERPVAAAPT